MASSKKKIQQENTLRDLENLARRLGLKISYGDMKFAGLKLKSGQCLFRGNPWLVLDRKQTFEEKLDLFRSALTQFPLDEQPITTELTGLLGLETPTSDGPATESSKVDDGPLPEDGGEPPDPTGDTGAAG